MAHRSFDVSFGWGFHLSARSPSHREAWCESLWTFAKGPTRHHRGPEATEDFAGNKVGARLCQRRQGARRAEPHPDDRVVPGRKKSEANRGLWRFGPNGTCAFSERCQNCWPFDRSVTPPCARDLRSSVLSVDPLGCLPDPLGPAGRGASSETELQPVLEFAPARPSRLSRGISREAARLDGGSCRTEIEGRFPPPV